MPGEELIRAFFEKASGQQTKSTVLNPLQWAMGIVLSAFSLTFATGAPRWASILLAIFASGLVGLYFFSFIYFMFKDPGALRSEKFAIQKLLIEKSLSGDDVSGLFETEDILALPQSPKDNTSQDAEVVDA